MSRRRDRERAEDFVYRNGQRVPRSSWDEYQRKQRELAEEQRLKSLGLVKGKPKVAVAERAGLEKAEKRIMTPAELMNERRPLLGKSGGN